MPAACTAEKGDGYEVMEKLIRWIGWKFAVFFLALFLPLLEACESPVHFYSYPASPLTCGMCQHEKAITVVICQCSRANRTECHCYSA